MIRTALDSDDLSVFTSQTEFILTYSDLVTQPAAFEAEHKGQTVVYIDRGTGDPDNKATIADVETGAYRPADLPGWYDRKAAQHLPYLTYYCDRSNIPLVTAALEGRNMYRWIATWGGIVAVPGFVPLRGPDLVQISNSEQIGIHADLSLVLNPSWRPTPQPSALAGVLVDVGNAIRDLGQVGSNLSSAQAVLKSMQ